MPVLAILGATPFPAFADYPETIIADAPLLYYRFEEVDGADSLQDSSGNDVHSDDYFDVLLEEDGAIGKAAGFEGFGSVLTGLTFDPSESDFSIELLVKPFDLTGTQVMVSNQDGSGFGRSNLIVGGTGNFNSFLGGSTTASESFAEIDTWYHVVMTYDVEGPDTIRFYVDGEPSGMGTNVVEAADGNWVIGSHKSQGSQFTNSVLDEVAIYNYRLDDPNGDDDTADTKVTAHYQQYLRETVVIAGFTSDKDFLNAGETATLSWIVGEIDTLTLDNGIGDVVPITVDGNGSIEVMPTMTTTYVLTGEGPAGNETAEVTIEVNSPPTIESFTASANALIKGQTVTLTWETTNADTVTIEPGIGAVDASGSRDIQIDAAVTYTLTASNANATTSSDVSIAAKDGDPSLVAHWKIGEAAGETDGVVLISEINTGQNATFTEAPTWVTADLAPTVTTAAVEFDGVTFADTAGFNGITGAQDRTVTFWLKGDDVQNANATLVSWGGTALTTRWGIRIGTAGLNIRTEVAGSGSEGTAEIIDGEWHHVAVVFANDETPNIEDIVFYIDGELDELSLVGNTEINTSGANTVRIGASRTLANRGFTGQMDDIRIYNRALTQEEIGSVMTGGAGEPGNPFAITDVTYDGTKTVITWNSAAGQSFGIDSSTNLQNWVEVDDGVPASDGATTTYEDIDAPPGESYYRVREE